MSGSIIDYQDVVAGNAQAALVLFKVAMLCRRGKFAHGSRWVTLSRTELMAAAGMRNNKDHYYETIKFLIVEGFLLTDSALQVGVPGNSNRKTAFTVTEKLFEDILARRLRKFGEARVKTKDVQEYIIDIFGPPMCPKIDNDVSDERGVSVRTSTEMCPEIGGDVSETGDPSLYKRTLRELKKENSRTLSDGPRAHRKEPNSKDVEKWFREGCTKSDATYFHASWTRAAQKLAKDMLKEFGPEVTKQIVDACSSRWTLFAEFARERTSLRIPIKAEFFTIVRHRRVALEFAQKGIAASKLQFKTVAQSK